MNRLDLEIIEWAAWSLKQGEMGSQLCPGADKQLASRDEPDISFVPKNVTRKISRLSKMALNVAYRCIRSHSSSEIGPSVFCSRYGEYENTYAFLTALVQKELPSPTAFSHSVHNTSSGLFSIAYANRHRSLVLAGGADLVEQAIVTAWCMRSPQPVLVVYHEDCLPDIYGELFGRELIETMPEPIALAMLVRPTAVEADGSKLMRGSLSWAPTDRTIDSKSGAIEVMRLIELLSTGHGQYQRLSERLTWIWHVQQH